MSPASRRSSPSGSSRLRPRRGPPTRRPPPPPSPPRPGTRTSAPPPVRILDAHGNLTLSTANVAIAIASGTGNPAATLGGTLTRAAGGGVATFDDLSIHRAAAGHPPPPP